MTTVPDAWTVLRSAVAPLLGYAIALGAALVLMVLVVVAIALQEGGSVDSDPTSDIDIEAISTLIGMPFQVTGMALGGSLGLGDADFRIALYAPPLLVTAVFAIAVFQLSKRAERIRPSTSPTERTIVALSGALITALTVTLLTRLLAMRSDGVAMHAATVGLFFGALAVAGAAALAGRQTAHGTWWPQWIPSDARRAAHLVTQHVIVWTAVATPVAAVWLLVESGPEAALYAVVWGPTVAFGAFALGHGGAVTLLGDSDFAWGLGWAPGVILPLLAIGLALIASIAWHLRRGGDRAWLAQPASWVYLPVAYALGGLIVCLLSTVGLSGALYGVGGGASFHGAYWLIAVLAVWGAAIEALSRYGAPALARAIPRPVAQRLAKGPAHVVSPPVPPTQRIPMSPSDRARVKRALIVTGVLGGLGLVAIVAATLIGSAAFSPEKEAEKYLDALVAGNAEEALALAPVDEDEASTALLTNEIFRAAEKRVTGYDITSVETDGDVATITADLHGVDDGRDVTLHLAADGHTAVFFRDWKIDEGGLARRLTISMPESSTSLVANGASIDIAGGDDADFWALPGTYAFDPYGENRWLEPTAARTVVPPSESWGNYVEIETPEPSAELRDVVSSALEKWLDGCMAATTLDPANCPQDAIGYGEKARKITWTLTTTPTVSWDSFDGTFPVELSPDTTGSARVSYEYDASYGFGAPDWTTQTEDDDLYVEARVDLVDGEPHVTFQDY
jgi:hypothetical protein